MCEKVRHALHRRRGADRADALRRDVVHRHLWRRAGHARHRQGSFRRHLSDRGGRRQRALGGVAEGGRLGPHVELRRRRARLRRRPQGDGDLRAARNALASATTSRTYLRQGLRPRSRRLSGFLRRHPPARPDHGAGIRSSGGRRARHARLLRERHLGDLLGARPARAAVQAGAASAIASSATRSWTGSTPRSVRRGPAAFGRPAKRAASDVQRAELRSRRERPDAGDFDALPHEEKLAASRELAATALAQLRPRRAGSEPVLINLSENATYRIDDRVPAGAGRSASTATATTRGTPSPPNSPGCRRSAHDGVVDTPVPVAGRDGELIQEACAPGDAAAAPRRAVRLGERRRALREGSPHRQIRGARRGDRPHASAFAALEAAGEFRAAHLGFRHEPRRPRRIGAAGATAWGSTRRRRRSSTAPST